MGALLAAPMLGAASEALGSRQETLRSDSLEVEMQKAPVAMQAGLE